MPVSGVELMEITRGALFNLRAAALHFGPREVFVTIVDRLNLEPSMATLAVLSCPSLRQSTTNWAQT
jgi:hypothetical protein